MKVRKKFYFALLFPLLFTLQSSVFAAEDVESLGQQGELIWADLYSGDIDSSIDFYTKTFAWTVKTFGEKSSRYHLFYDENGPVAGVLARDSRRDETENALWIGSIATESVRETVTQAAENKATIILEPHDFALYGERAVFADPQGGIIALLDLDENDINHQSISPQWSWAQLFSVEPQKASLFYQAILDYEVEQTDQSQDSFYLSQQGNVQASIVKMPESFEQRDRWVNFIEVEGVAEHVEKAQANGAKVIYSSEANDIAIISDPNGALLGLTESLSLPEGDL